MNPPSFLARPLRLIPVIVLVLLLVASAAAQARGALAAPWHSGGASTDPAPVTVTAIPAAQTAGGAALGWQTPVLRTVVPPVFFDLDGDGMLDVIAGDDRYVYVFDHLGNPRPGWPRDVGGAMMQAAVADLESDGAPEILWGTTFPTPRLWAFTAAGATKPGWPVALPYVTLANATCPVVADLDGDAELEVGIATETGVSFFNPDGTPVPGWPYQWPVPVNNPQWSAPAVGDLDGDGSPEVVVGNACYPNWGAHVIRADGTPMPGWPQVIKPVWSSPALADLDGDSDLEIVMQEGDPGSQGFRLWVWHHTGSALPGWPKAIAAEGQSSRSSPAIGDVDNDGDLEIVTATADGLLHVVTLDTSELPGWPRATGGVQPIASPALIDIDEDGVEEMFLTYWLANTQYASGWRLDGTVLAGFPQTLFTGTDLNSHSSVHVADADLDLDLELTASASSFNQGRILVLDVEGSSYDPVATRRDWPKMRRDAENTGTYVRGTPAAAAAAPPAAAMRLVVAPNPALAGGEVRIIAPAAAGWLSAFDAQGRLLGRARIAGGGTRTLRLSDLLPAQNPASGVYFLRFGSDHGVETGTRFVLVGR